MRWLLLSLCCALVCCSPQQRPETDESAALAAASAAWDAAFNVGDATRLGDRYDEAAVSMPPGLPTLHGREQIRADFTTFFAANTAEHHTRDAERTVSGDLAVERAQYNLTVTPREGGVATKESGKHIVVYRRQTDGSWKVLWEIWNTPAT